MSRQSPSREEPGVARVFLRDGQRQECKVAGMEITTYMRESMRRVAIDCLRCRHTTMAESDLETLGFKRGVSLVLVTKKLICSKCESKAVRAYRYIDDELPPMLP